MGLCTYRSIDEALALSKQVLEKAGPGGEDGKNGTAVVHLSELDDGVVLVDVTGPQTALDRIQGITDWDQSKEAGMKK